MGKRGGYRREKPLYRLKFASEEFEGLEVMAKSIPLREFFELASLQDQAATDAGAQEKVIRRLADVITNWNLEDDEGQPVPCTYEALCEYDMPFVLQIFFAWMSAVSDIPNLSPGTSNGGGTSPEPSIPMEVSLPGPQS